MGEHFVPKPSTLQAVLQAEKAMDLVATYIGSDVPSGSQAPAAADKVHGASETDAKFSRTAKGTDCLQLLP